MSHHNAENESVQPFSTIFLFFVDMDNQDNKSGVIQAPRSIQKTINIQNNNHLKTQMLLWQQSPYRQCKKQLLAHKRKIGVKI